MKINERTKGILNNAETSRLGKKDEIINSDKFKSELQEIKTLDSYNYLSDLADRIAQQGKRLSNSIDINELRYYKKMVSKFLQSAVGDTYYLNKDSLSDRKGRMSVFSSVEKVNKNLDMLTEEVLKDEKDHIKIIKLLDDIRGLILDVYL